MKIGDLVKHKRKEWIGVVIATNHTMRSYRVSFFNNNEEFWLSPIFLEAVKKCP